MICMLKCHHYMHLKLLNRKKEHRTKIKLRYKKKHKKMLHPKQNPHSFLKPCEYLIHSESNSLHVPTFLVCHSLCLCLLEPHPHFSKPLLFSYHPQVRQSGDGARIHPAPSPDRPTHLHTCSHFPHLLCRCLSFPACISFPHQPCS